MINSIYQEFRRVFKKLLFFGGYMVFVVGSGYWKKRESLVERVLTGKIDVVEKLANDPLYVFDKKNCFFCNNRIYGKMYQITHVEGKLTSRYSLDENCYEGIALKVN
jgi:hypothetical protein